MRTNEVPSRDANGCPLCWVQNGQPPAGGCSGCKLSGSPKKCQRAHDAAYGVEAGDAPQAPPHLPRGHHKRVADMSHKEHEIALAAWRRRYRPIANMDPEKAERRREKWREAQCRHRGFVFDHEPMEAE